MTKEELKKMRENLWLTQMQLAEELGVKNNTVARWENGRLPISKMVGLAMQTVAANRGKSEQKSAVVSAPVSGHVAAAVTPPTRPPARSVADDSRANIAEIEAKLRDLPRHDTRELELRYGVTLPEIADDDSWLETNDIAAMLGKKPRTVRDMFTHRYKPLPRFQTPTKVSLVKKSDLRAYLIPALLVSAARQGNSGDE